ncbi:MAG: tRNA pseudouridine(38-40) synthase TruA [Tepidisphaeraceae bacterium]
MSTQRYKLTIAYRGTRYHGWQIQPANELYKGPPPPEGLGIPTVQQSLVRAISHITSQPVRVAGSSRTDAGVHAKGQVAHFDIEPTVIPLDSLRRAINHALPGDILIRSIEPVPDTFDAVKSTVCKRYQYFIWHAPDRPIFFGDLAWHRWQRLDIGALRAAAEPLVGEHDFASFARAGHGRENTVRKINAIDITERGPRIIIGIEGNGFLWHMVRIIVGTLVEVALGKRDAASVRQALEARNRQSAGPTAPPHGLYLQWIRHALEPAQS